jgi:ligand-binding sensor domain-containing protein
MISGSHSGDQNDPLNGVDLAPRQSNGSFGPLTSIAPALVAPFASPANGAVLSSDGSSPLWISSSLGGLDVFDGASDLANPQVPLYPPGVVEGPSLARDSAGRLWVAWYLDAYTSSFSGVYMAQLDPATGAQVSGTAAVRAPNSAGEQNAGNQIATACDSSCHVIYRPGTTRNTLVSWAPGQTAPATVVEAAGAHTMLQGVVAAGAPGGRLWVVYTEIGSFGFRVDAKLGDADGAGGTATTIAPAASSEIGYAGAAVGTAHWARSRRGLDQQERRGRRRLSDDRSRTVAVPVIHPRWVM